MREPPDPLRHSYQQNLDLDENRQAVMDRLTAALKQAQREASEAQGHEQIETAARRQDEAQDAIENLWRRIAAEQIEGAAAELKAWDAWRAVIERHPAK